MKKLIIIFILIVAVNQAQAQFFQLGAKAGLSSSQLKVSETFIPGEDQETIYYKGGDAILGWHAGLYSRIKIWRIYVQPELLYSSTGGKIRISSDGIDYPEVGKFKLDKLDIPIMLGFHITKGFRVFAGPSLSYLISDKSIWKTTREIFTQDFRKGTMGYQAGIGFDISTFSLDLKYEGNLSKLGNSVSIPGSDISFNTDLRNPQVILSMGFRF